MNEYSDISTEDAFKILNDISSYANPVVVLSGGEPLLRSDIFEIARYGTEKGLRMCLATNGTLITDETCKKIKRAGITIVSLSLDGSTAKTHDDFRSERGAFEGAVNAARIFKKHGIEFIINSSFTKRNQDEITEVYSLAKGLGATAWYMFMLVPTGRGVELMDELISKKDYEEILDWHYRMEKDEKDILVRPTCAPQYYRVALQKAKEDGIKFERRSLKFSTGSSKSCLAGQLICLIDLEGNVLPCSYFPEPAGNILRQPFKEIWERSELFNKLRDFKKYRGKCSLCEFMDVCGGCRARAYAVCGDYLAEEPFCSYTPRGMRRHEREERDKV